MTARQRVNEFAAVRSESRVHDAKENDRMNKLETTHQFGLFAEDPKPDTELVSRVNEWSTVGIQSH